MSNNHIPDNISSENAQQKQKIIEALQRTVIPYLENAGFCGDFPNYKRFKFNVYHYLTFDFMESADLRFRILLGSSSDSALESAWKAKPISFLAKDKEDVHYFLVRENKFAHLLYDSQSNLTRFSGTNCEDKFEQLALAVLEMTQERLELTFLQMNNRLN